MRIGELARQAGVSVRSLRYYEERGLLEAQRTSGGTHRVYGPDAVARVRLLRQLYAAGLTSAAIASLLPCVDAPSTHTTRESLSVMQTEHSRLNEQMRAMAETRDQLSYLIECASRYLREHPQELPEPSEAAREPEPVLPR
jgi:DNA-binding transcriptional MerR regulator